MNIRLLDDKGAEISIIYDIHHPNHLFETHLKEKYNASSWEEFVLPRTKEQRLVKIRNRRNVLLQNSDWALMPDSPLSEEMKESWSLYRQKLRDLPEDVDINFPVWPQPPVSE